MESQPPTSPQSTDYSPETKIDNQQAVVRSPSALPLMAMAIFILLSIAAVAFLYYQNQQLKSMLAGYQMPTASPTQTATPDPTANWKTYSNPKFGFEIQYPSDGKTSPRDEGMFPVITQIDNFQPGNEVHGFPVGWMIIIFEPQPNKNKLSLRQWATKNSSLSDVAIDLKIGGKPAISWRTTGGDADILNYLIMNKSDEVILITVNPAVGYENVIDKIIATFKFLEVPTASTSTPTPEDMPIYY